MTKIVLAVFVMLSSNFALANSNLNNVCTKLDAKSVSTRTFISKGEIVVKLNNPSDRSFKLSMRHGEKGRNLSNYLCFIGEDFISKINATIQDHKVGASLDALSEYVVDLFDYSKVMSLPKHKGTSFNKIIVEKEESNMDVDKYSMSKKTIISKQARNQHNYLVILINMLNQYNADEIEFHYNN